MYSPREHGGDPLPFDQHQRYGLAAAIIETWRGGREAFRILEVGAHVHRNLELFLPDDRLVYLDLEVEGVPRGPAPVVQGDATRPVFLDDAFDFVVALDVLEHVPPERRPALVSEMMRVAREGIVLAAPFDSPEVVEEETRVNAMYRRAAHENHPWLSEHRLGVLPSLDETVRWIGRSGWHVGVWAHGNVHLWSEMMEAQLFGLVHGLPEHVHRLNEHYNEMLLEDDWQPPTYRHFIVAARDGARIDALAETLAGDGRVDAADRARLDELLGEMRAAAAPPAAPAAPAEAGEATPADPPPGPTLEQRRLGDAENLLDRHEQTLAGLRQETRETRRRLADRDEELAVLRRSVEMQSTAAEELRHIAEELAEQRRAIERLREAQERAASRPLASPGDGAAGDGPDDADDDDVAAGGGPPPALREIHGRLDGMLHRLDQLTHRVAEIHAARAEASRRPRRAGRRGLPGRLFRWRRHEMEPVPAAEILREGDVYRSRGGDPQLHLRSSRGALPSGWTVLSIEAEGRDVRLEPDLYADGGEGFFESATTAIPPFRSGRSISFHNLPDTVRALRLDPASCPGSFRIRRVTMREVGVAWLLLWLVAEIGRGAGLRPAVWLRLVVESLGVLRREGLEAHKQWMLRQARAGRSIGRSPYGRWVDAHDTLANRDRRQIRQRIERLDGWPLVTVLVDGPAGVVSPEDVRRTVESVRRQLYPEWEILLAEGLGEPPSLDGDPGPADLRLRRGGPPAGDLVARIRAGDELSEHALYLAAEELRAWPETDLLFADEDRLGPGGRRRDPVWKGGLDIDRLRTRNDLAGLLVVRASMLPAEWTSDHDLALRLAEAIPAERIRHVPHVLCHARRPAPAPSEAREALAAHLRRVGSGATLVREGPDAGSVRHPLPAPAPRVSVVVPGRASRSTLVRLLEGLRTGTGYPHLETLVVAGPGESEAPALEGEELDRRFGARLLRAASPSLSSACNLGLRESRGEIVAFLHPGLAPEEPRWLEEMVGHALRPGVGAVGARLRLADGTIHHDGLLLGLGPERIAASPPAGHPAATGSPRGVGAVSWHALVARRDVLLSAGGFDEERLPGSFADVDLCLRLRESGLRTVLVPGVELRFAEGAAPVAGEMREGVEAYQAAAGHMRTRWADALRRDPAGNPNLDATRPGRLASPPDVRRPWETERVEGGGSEETRALEPYEAWLLANAWNARREAGLRERIARLDALPRISVLMPVHDPVPEHLDRAIESVASQVYAHWELCIADDVSRRPEIRRILERWAARDARIRVTYRTEPGNISATTNDAAALATGEYLALLDHDDELSPDALGEVACHAAAHARADVIYSDDDKITADGRRYDPQYKPDWSPEHLLSSMYLSHLLVIRRRLWDEVGGTRSAFDGAQDFDLALRATERARAVEHIPAILYHWRAAPGSVASTGRTKPYALEAGRRALGEAARRRGMSVRVSQPQWARDAWAGIYSMDFPDDGPRVSIIIPTRNEVDLLQRCVDSLERTTYRNYEVVIVDNESDDPATLEYLRETPHRVLCIPNRGETFSFAAVNNEAVRRVTGELLLFLNNDTEVVAPEWLSQMVGYLGIDGVGAVGARLLYPDGRVQHAGVVQGIVHGGVGHANRFVGAHDLGYLASARVTRNYLAVTAACLLTPRQRFLEMGGFDEERFAVAFNDVDYGFRLHSKGLRCVYAPRAELIHHEGGSRGFVDRAADVVALRETYGHWRDPYYSHYLSRDHEQMQFEARTRAPEGGPPVRVLVWTPGLDADEAGRFLLETVLGLVRRGALRPVIVSPRDGALRAAYEAHDIPVRIEGRAPGRAMDLAAYHVERERLEALIEETAAELLLAHTSLGFPAVDAARVAGLPSLWGVFEENRWDGRLRGFRRPVLEAARRAFAYPYQVVFGAHETKDHHRGLLQRRNGTVVEAVIDRAAFRARLARASRPDARRELGVADREVLVLAPRHGIARDDDGLVDLVEALGRLPRRHARRVRCIIPGGDAGDAAGRLREAVEELPGEWADRVTLPSADDGDDDDVRARRLVAADIVVGTSRDGGFSRLHQEAMAAGRPLVTTPARGLRRRRQKDGHALVHEPGDVRTLARHLGRLVDDEDLRARLGASAPVVLETHRGHDVCLDLWAELVREAALTGERPVPDPSAGVPAGGIDATHGRERSAGAPRLPAGRDAPGPDPASEAPAN